MSRLYALGYDAYQLLPEILRQPSPGPFAAGEIPGATGCCTPTWPDAFTGASPLPKSAGDADAVAGSSAAGRAGHEPADGHAARRASGQLGVPGAGTVAPGARHLQHGSAAEALAARYLADQRPLPVTRNFRARVGELDLVMTDRNVLVVVEVRARRQTNVITGAGATINRGKQRRLIGATRYFLLRYRQFASWPVRFDVVEITGELADPVIRWSRAAFSLDDVAGR